MPEFTRLPDGTLILRGTPAPSKPSGLKAALMGFMDAMRGAPKPEQWWIEKPKVSAAPAPAPAPALPAYNAWGDIEKEAAERNRITSGLGEFPQRMLASPLAEGRLF